jgi:hypothetical protein
MFYISAVLAAKQLPEMLRFVLSINSLLHHVISLTIIDDALTANEATNVKSMRKVIRFKRFL